MHRLALTVAFLSLLAAETRVQFPDPEPDKDGVYFARYVVTNPTLVRAVPADYASDPKTASIKHVCVLSAVISTDGTVSSVSVENAKPSPVDAAAIAAVKQSVFSPGLLHDRAVPVRMEVWVPFPGDGNPAVPMMVQQKAETSPAPTVFPEAEFSPAARKAHIQGAVMVSLLVNEDGAPTDPHLLNHLPKGLDEQALKAVGKYHFKPAMRSGEAIPCRIIVAINFRL